MNFETPEAWDEVNEILHENGYAEITQGEQCVEIIGRLVRCYRQATRGPSMPGIDLYWDRPSRRKEADSERQAQASPEGD